MKYNKGATAERSIIHFLSEEGYQCLRSAGSKGAYDIVAFNNHVVRFIQSKYQTVVALPAKSDRKKTFLPAVPTCATKELWVFSTGMRCVVVYTTNIDIEYPTGVQLCYVDNKQIQRLS